SSTAAILLLRYAPFPMIMRILILFGYFFIYEYTVISRNYSLGLLLMICCCILYRKRSGYYFLLSVTLGALANTHLFCLIVSLSFYIALVFDYFFHQQLTQRQKGTA